MAELQRSGNREQLLTFSNSRQDAAGGARSESGASLTTSDEKCCPFATKSIAAMTNPQPTKKYAGEIEERNKTLINTQRKVR